MGEPLRRATFFVCTFALLALLPENGSGGAAAKEAAVAKRAVEIRAYNLKPGTRDEFNRLANEEAVPMLERWKIDVVAYGPSAHDDRSYYLIRSFPSLADRERSEEAFYGSEEWRNGPREAVLARIESYTTVVLELEPAAVEALRRR